MYACIHEVAGEIAEKEAVSVERMRVEIANFVDDVGPLVRKRNMKEASVHLSTANPRSPYLRAAAVVYDAGGSRLVVRRNVPALEAGIQSAQERPHNTHEWDQKRHEGVLHRAGTLSEVRDGAIRLLRG
jgi:hypothetical protein